MGNRIKKSTLVLFGKLILALVSWVAVFIVLKLLFPSVSPDTIMLHTMGILYLAWIIIFIRHKKKTTRPEKKSIFPKI